MAKRAALALAMSLAATGASASTDQFNLACKGSSNGKPIEYGFRIDLAAKLWCELDCVAPRQIVEVGPDRIVLERSDREDRGPTRGDTFSRTDLNQINRMDGAHREYHSALSNIRGQVASSSRRERSGTCETAPFTGLPTAKF